MRQHAGRSGRDSNVVVPGDLRRFIHRALSHTLPQIFLFRVSLIAADRMPVTSKITKERLLRPSDAAFGNIGLVDHLSNILVFAILVVKVVFARTGHRLSPQVPSVSIAILPENFRFKVTTLSHNLIKDCRPVGQTDIASVDESMFLLYAVPLSAVMLQFLRSLLFVFSRVVLTVAGGCIALDGLYEVCTRRLPPNILRSCAGNQLARNVIRELLLALGGCLIAIGTAVGVLANSIVLLACTVAAYGPPAEGHPIRTFRTLLGRD
jgi:hypothetical protein